MKILVSSVILIPYASSSQNPGEDNDFVNFGEDYTEGLTWLKGKGILEEWFIDGFLPLYGEFMKDEYTQLTSVASIIAGLMALLYLSNLGWQFLSGAKQWDIMAILKPFGLGLIIMFWSDFVNLVKEPFYQMQNSSMISYQATDDELTALRLERFILQQKTLDEIYKMSAEYTTMKEADQQDMNMLEEFISDAYNSLVSPVQNIVSRLNSSINFAITGLLEILALWILRLAAYSIFLIQVIMQTILIIVGPLAVAFSILPAFSNSFVSWLQKFINVSMYGFLAFIILKLGSKIQMFALEAEIDRYKDMFPDGPGDLINRALIISFTSQGLTSFGIVIISFIMTAIGLTLVPKISDYIVGSGGQNSSMIKGAIGGAAIMSGKIPMKK